MSVVVLNMEMPRACIDGHYYGNCPMDRVWCAQRFAPEGRSQADIFRDRKDKVPDWCPIRPLPDGHGDLIDRDEFMIRFRSFLWAGDFVIEALKKEPAIIEAEGGSDA
jgi:hypothetical protein